MLIVLILLIALPEWWLVFGIVVSALGAMKGIQMLWASALAWALRQNALLKKDYAQLLRESEVRLDDLKDRSERIQALEQEVDELQKQVTNQRKMAKELLESGDGHGK